MSFEQRQDNVQKQKHKISPQQYESLKNLIKPYAKLQAELDLETITDLLHVVETQNYVEDETETVVDEDGEVSEDIDWDDYWPDDDKVRTRRKTHTQFLPLDEKNLSDSRKSLKFHLLQQLRLSGMNVVQSEIAFCLIDNIDSDGYLKPSIEELRWEEGKYDIETWNRTLKLIKQFDPPGVAAKDLKECILIQARSNNYQNIGLIESIVEKHWDDVEDRNYDLIAQSLSIDIREVVKVLKYISKLNPKPGQQYNQTVSVEDNEDTLAANIAAIQRMPEYKIIQDGDGYIIDPEYEYADIPERISSYYHEKLKSGDSSYPEGLDNDEISYVKGVRKKVPEYLRRGDKTAPLSVYEMKNLSNMLENAQKKIEERFDRHENTVKVILSVAKFQKNYLDTGDITTLKPLIARDVADDIKDETIDESKVRRIRRNKYIDTRIGIIKLEDFFDKVGIDTKDGQKMASKAVKRLIKDLIESEKKTKPYSDRQITDYLKQDCGIDINRRTVSNYRESLEIPNSSERRWRA